MTIDIKSYRYILLNALIIVLILLLPFYIFGGRLFVGGDDTRLFYAYPEIFISRLSFFSWNNISSLPSYLPNQQSLPMLILLSILVKIIGSRVWVSYLAFSMPFILGFLYFQKFIREIIGEDYLISFVASLIFVFSPITIINQYSVFLTPVWLVGLFPIVAYYFTSYLKKGKKFDLFMITLWSIILSIGFYTIPWILGLLFPLAVSLIFTLFLVKNSVVKLVKKTVIFVAFIISSQLFWLVPFVSSIFQGGEGGLGGRAVSRSIMDTFSPTVLSTATGNILYPLLTIFHRQIAFDFNWQIKDVFINYYDKVLPLSLIFVVVLFLGITNFKKVLKGDLEKIFTFFFLAFIFSLYFFTVNIGVLKYLFLILGYLPGFVMFRNFFDKFALGYIFIYASLLGICLYIVKKTFKQYPFLILGVILVVIVNFIPVKQIVNSPLWLTRNIYRVASLPDEYLNFAHEVEVKVPSTTNIIGIPQNIASYAVIMEDNNTNGYIGTSPLRFFSGVNDLTGSLSYQGEIDGNIRNSIMQRDYKKLIKVLNDINVGYLMRTKNVPAEVNKSYLFDRNYVMFQDDKLIQAVTSREVARSSNGNYILYKLRTNPSLISSGGSVAFNKVNNSQYDLYIKNLNGIAQLKFIETYNSGWGIVLSNGCTNCKSGFFDGILSAVLSPSPFNSSHIFLNPYGNEWDISSTKIKNYGAKYYTSNPNGSINAHLILYFKPQLYFYLGLILTCISLSACIIYILKDEKNII